MLTHTYALVALSVEQKKVQLRVRDIQECMQRLRTSRAFSDRGKLESLLKALFGLNEIFATRNFELFVLPALRAATEEVNKLLTEIEQLSYLNNEILKSLRERWSRATDYSGPEMVEFCDAIELYCQQLSTRLAIEESHLLPVAQRAISGDEWFDIAAQFISHESERGTRKTSDRRVNANPTPSPSYVAGYMPGGSVHLAVG